MDSEIEYYLCFTATLTSSRPSNPAPYSDYQSELHDLIQALHDKGMGYRKIAYWLNDNGYKTPRGKRFVNTTKIDTQNDKRRHIVSSNPYTMVVWDTERFLII